MPAIASVVEDLQAETDLDGLTVACVLHVTSETGVFVEALHSLGAEVALAGSNPLTTQDEVAAYLSDRGIHVYAYRGETESEYFTMIDEVLDYEPQLVVDDGADAHTRIHEERRDVAHRVIGGTEETTTGLVRERALEREGRLLYPVMAVNDAKTKRMFDNTYGTGQSTLDGLMRSTTLLLAGKTVVVCGFGSVGKGIAKRASGMGCKVIVTEVDPLRALEAHVEGFAVMPLEEAAPRGDFFVTATGQTNVIRREHMEAMKDGAILANSGHFNVEISLEDLEELSESDEEVRRGLQEYGLKDGRDLYLLARGRLVNLVSATGHPPEVMMASFSTQLLSLDYLVREGEGLEKEVLDVPQSIEGQVARHLLQGWGVEIDDLTEEQKRYEERWI